MSTGESVISLRVIILGTDALLEARPATPIQLARACLKAGYDFVAPVSWGEELLATRIIESVKDIAPPSSLIVHCPFVAEALREQNEVLPMMWRAAAPPVVAARYVRAAFAPRTLHVTYAGHCPGASAPDLDACMLPQVLFGLLLEMGIDPDEEPKYFEEMLPPDRSRYASLPGGVPDPALLHDSAGARLREAAAATLRAVALAFESSEPVVIDLEAASGCVCARDRFAASQLEPPRSPTPVVTSGLDVDLAHYRSPREPMLRREVLAPNAPSAPATPAPQSMPPSPRPQPPASEPRRAAPEAAGDTHASSIASRQRNEQESSEQWPPADLVATLEPWLRKLTPPQGAKPAASNAEPPPAAARDTDAPAPSIPPASPSGHADADAGVNTAPPTESDAATQVGDAFPPRREVNGQGERDEPPKWEQHIRRSALLVLIAGGILGGSAYAAHRAGWPGFGARNRVDEPALQQPEAAVVSPSSGERAAAADSAASDSLIPTASPRADTIPSAADTLIARGRVAHGDVTPPR